MTAPKILFGLLTGLLPPSFSVLIGVDDTIERRRGRRIRDIGVWRDPVRSSEKHVVKCFGLRWVSMMLLVPLCFSPPGIDCERSVQSMINQEVTHEQEETAVQLRGKGDHPETAFGGTGSPLGFV